MRALGLDVGEKSCGIALSDLSKIIAQGKETYRFQSRDWNALYLYLKKNYFKEVNAIVIGLPLLPSGDKSKTTIMIEQFKEFLSQKTMLPIIFVEEFGTTKKAHDVMIRTGLSRKKRKIHKDKISAVLILQDYLERI